MLAIPGTGDMEIDWKSLLLGMFLMFIILLLISSYLPPTENSKYDYSKKLLSPSEACKLFYNCSAGYGNLGSLNCECNGTWKNFGLKDLLEVVK